MNKTAIKNFSIRARNKLIQDIKQKAYELGITEKEIKNIETFEGGFQVEGTDIKRTIKYYPSEKVEKIIEEKRNDLVSKIKDKGIEQVIEEVAYTWFNRFIALRFMEVNDYLPTGVRVLSSEDNTVEPDIIKEALNLDLDIDKEIVYNLQDINEIDELYKYLLIKQCNKLGEIMPTVFEEIADYTELLLPDNLLAEGSIIRDLIESIDEEDYKEQVEIIGWMYQYYISEKKDEVFAGLKKNKKITKENIPAATQLFTPKWIVKYMVENSLGRLWLESHPDDELKAQWEYYLEEAEQDPDVQRKLDELKDPNLNPEDIKILDNAMGSGHILVYCFDVIYDIYLKAGYPERKIPQLILEKNLYGLDIDDRAAQLATFALLMKARSKNRRIFRRKIDVNLCSIQESNGISNEAIEFFANGNEKLKKEIGYLVDVYSNAKEFGSILDVKEVDFEALEDRVVEIRDEHIAMFNQGYRNIILKKIPNLMKQAKIMSSKYDVVCTNPPYLGRQGMNKKLTKYVDKNYKLSKKDLFSVFIEVGFKFLKPKGLNSMVTMHSWMFLNSYKKLRKKIIDDYSIYSILHLGYEAFENIVGKVVQTCAFIIRKNNISLVPHNVRLIDYYDSRRHEKETQFFNLNNRYNEINQLDFNQVPGYIFAYWISRDFLKIFKRGVKLEDKALTITKGIFTGNNAKFIRYWYEVNKLDILTKRWNKYSKGGPYRRWYGNSIYVVKWGNNGEQLKEYEKSGMGASKYYDLPHIVWSKVTTLDITFRKDPKEVYFDDASPAIVFKENSFDYTVLGFVNSKVCREITKVLGPTMNYQIGDIKSIPIIDIQTESKNEKVKELTTKCLDIAKQDWDTHETSWDFKNHPFLENGNNVKKIEQAFNNWVDFTKKQFIDLKKSEEEINRTFIEIYGLEDELTPEVEEDITIRNADKEVDIKSFISYAVGCMFGRYSLDEEGLVYAGGEFNVDRYKKFKPVEDNVIPITTDDYFEDDIVSRFVEFVKVTFGEETLEENLEYIAETIGKKSNETPRQAIRDYFTKKSGFYKDHVKTYSKTPIYWMFDSGKQDGFKALIYMHRYEPSLVAKVRTDYLHELQKKYDAEINRLERLIDSDVSVREKSAARKQRDKVSKQLEECKEYDQVIAHVANQRIDIDLDDGVKVNYAKFQKVEVPRGDGKKPLKANLLAKL